MRRRHAPGGCAGIDDGAAGARRAAGRAGAGVSGLCMPGTPRGLSCPAGAATHAAGVGQVPVAPRFRHCKLQSTHCYILQILAVPFQCLAGAGQLGN